MVYNSYNYKKNKQKKRKKKTKENTPDEKLNTHTHTHTHSLSLSLSLYLFVCLSVHFSAIQIKSSCIVFNFFSNSPSDTLPLRAPPTMQANQRSSTFLRAIAPRAAAGAFLSMAMTGICRFSGK